MLYHGIQLALLIVSCCTLVVDCTCLWLVPETFLQNHYWLYLVCLLVPLDLLG